MKKVSPEVTYHAETVEINGRTAVLFVPELVDQLAVVDLTVIRRLAALLPTADLQKIKRDFKSQLDDCTSMEMYVAALRNELSFHESVNMITLYKPEVKENELTSEPVKAESRPWQSVNT